MTNLMLSKFIVAVIALASGGVGVLTLVLAWRAWRGGQARVRRLTFDRQNQPGLFWLILAVYTFVAITAVCFGVFLLGLLGMSAFG